MSLSLQKTYPSPCTSHSPPPHLRMKTCASSSFRPLGADACEPVAHGPTHFPPIHRFLCDAPICWHRVRRIGICGWLGNARHRVRNDMALAVPVLIRKTHILRFFSIFWGNASPRPQIISAPPKNISAPSPPKNLFPPSITRYSDSEGRGRRFFRCVPRTYTKKTQPTELKRFCLEKIRQTCNAGP